MQVKFKNNKQHQAKLLLFLNQVLSGTLIIVKSKKEGLKRHGDSNLHIFFVNIFHKIERL